MPGFFRAIFAHFWPSWTVLKASFDNGGKFIGVKDVVSFLLLTLLFLTYLTIS